MKTIFMLFILLNMSSNVQGTHGWPSGTYGLPRPSDGCPQFWKEGLRYHDTEDDNSNNRHSVSMHLSGTVNEHGIRQEFCIKDEDLFDSTDESWPEGEYCIHKYGSKCPKGLKEGWVFWDDENDEEIDGGNMVHGYTPEGVYEEDTLMYFCCMDGGNKSVPIKLPIDRSFYLLAYKSAECQAVEGTTPVLEFVQWDDEDRANTNARSEEATPYGVKENRFNTKIFYCFYNAGACGRFGGVCQNTSTDYITSLENTFDEHRNRRRLGERVHNPAVAVAVGCGVAGVILGSALAAIVTRRYLSNHKDDHEEGFMSEEELPLPDHIW